VRSIAMTVSVCLFVCLSTRTSQKQHVQTSGNFTSTLTGTRYMLPVTRTSSDDNGINYVLPVLWMTSCFPTMGYVARGAWQHRRRRRAEATSQNFQRIRQSAPRCLTVVVYNGSKLRTGGRSLMSTIVLLCRQFISLLAATLWRFTAAPNP